MKENARAGANTYFTYALKKGDRVFEIPDMKDGDDKLNICVVTDAVDSVEPAGLTERVLLRRTLERTQIHIGQWIGGGTYMTLPNVDQVRHLLPEPCQL